MKRIILILLLLCSVAFSANTYVISGKGTGADGTELAGGGFVTGGTATYSTFQGTNGAPLFTGTGCTYTHATKNINKSGIGTASVVGALVYVSGTNITTGRYAVTTITDADNIICSGITSTGDNTDTVANVGGAIDTAATPQTNALGLVDGLLASGDTLLIPGANRTYTESDTCTIASASAGATINIIGVANDGTAITAVRDTPTNGVLPNGPLNTTQFPIVNFSGTASKYLAIGDYNCIKCLYLKASTSTTTGVVGNSSTDYPYIDKCIIENIGTGRIISCDVQLGCYNSDILSSSSTHAAYLIVCGNYCKIRSNRLYSGDTGGESVLGLVSCGLGAVITHNVFYELKANSAITIGVASPKATILNNTFYDCVTCITTTNAAGTVGLDVIDNIAVNCTNFLINGYVATADQHLFVKGNVYYNVTNVMTDADWYGLSATAALGFTALSADPFSNAANDDFTVSNTADTLAKIIGKGAFGQDIGACGHDPDYADLANVKSTDTNNGQPGTLDMSLYALISGIVFPDEADVWYGTGTFGLTGTEYTPAMRASDITVTGGAAATLTAPDIVNGVVVDDVTGTASGGGSGGGPVLGGGGGKTGGK